MSDEFPFSETAWIVFQEQSSLFEISPAIRVGSYVAKTNEPTETIGIVTNINGTMAEISVPYHFERAFTHFLNGEHLKQEEEEIINLIETEGFSLIQTAHACYGASFHSIYDIEREYFDEYKIRRLSCQHEGCSQQAIGVGIINVWGTVIPVAMCLEHSYYHGYGFESNEFNQPLSSI